MVDKQDSKKSLAQDVVLEEKQESERKKTVSLFRCRICYEKAESPAAAATIKRKGDLKDEGYDEDPNQYEQTLIDPSEEPLFIQDPKRGSLLGVFKVENTPVDDSNQQRKGSRISSAQVTCCPICGSVDIEYVKEAKVV